MRSFLRFVFLATAVALPVAWPQSAPLPWLFTGEALSPERFEALVRVASQDPVVQGRLDHALEALHMDSVDDLMPYFSVVERLGEEEGGRTVGPRARNITLVPLAPGTDGEEQLRAAEARARAASPEVRVSRSAATGQVREYAPAVFCIVSGRPLLESFTVFMHELTHFAAYSDELDRDLLSFSGVEDFIQQHLEGPGGELEAYEVQQEAFLRLRGRFNDGRSYEMDRYFDAEGRLTDRAGLLAYIRENMGYGARLRGEYLRLMTGQLDTTQQRADWERNELLPYARRLAARSPGDAAAGAYLQAVRAEIEELENRACAFRQRLSAAGTTIRVCEGYTEPPATAAAEPEAAPTPATAAL